MRSDHYPILLQLSEGNLIKGAVSQRIDTSKIDWSKFSEEQSNYFNSRPSSEANNYILEYEEFVKGLKISSEKSGALMLDDNYRRSAFHNYVNHSTFENSNIYEQVALEASKLFKKKKKDA